MTNADSDQPNVEPVEAPDQTNGLAGDLEGDDGGEQPEDEEQGSLLGDMLNNGLTLKPAQDDETGDKGYGEEGRP